MPQGIDHSRVILRLLLLALAFATMLHQGTESTALSRSVWQESIAPVVKIGIRNKEGSSSDKFAVTCLVNAPDGKQYKANMQVVGDTWGYMMFPDDFHALTKPGAYSWKCLVGGREVAAGGFEFSGTAYGNVLKVSRP